MTFIHLHRDHPKAHLIAPGLRIRTRYFDPNGPHAIDGMTTDEGTIARIDADPFGIGKRPIWIRMDDGGGLMDFFASSLQFDIPDGPIIDETSDDYGSPDDALSTLLAHLEDIPRAADHDALNTIIDRARYCLELLSTRGHFFLSDGNPFPTEQDPDYGLTGDGGDTRDRDHQNADDEQRYDEQQQEWPMECRDCGHRSCDC